MWWALNWKEIWSRVGSFDLGFFHTRVLPIVRSLDLFVGQKRLERAAAAKPHLCNQTCSNGTYWHHQEHRQQVWLRAVPHSVAPLQVARFGWLCRGLWRSKQSTKVDSAQRRSDFIAANEDFFVQKVLGQGGVQLAALLAHS